MQLNRRRPTGHSVGASLAAATAALLGQATPPDAVAQELLPWQIDTAMLYYGEADGRVRDFSLNALARKEIREESFLSVKLAVDSLTGASPNGAVPSNTAQTFTRPSGGGLYTVAPGEQPLDDSFLDTRTAFDVNWEWPATRLTLVNAGASVSDEYDYTHTGVNARIARDFNDRNTTLSLGVALANDTINPVGGTPIGLSPMLAPQDDEENGGLLANRRGDQSKDVVDLLLGVTQVVNRHTLFQLNYSLSQSDGYLTDPYKILSVVDAATGDLVTGPPGTGLDLYLHESRPDQREKQSVFARLKRDVSGDVIDVSYRYMTDDWGVDSHTVDLHYRWNLDGKYLQPHLRLYTQTAADFYSTVLFAGAPLPAYASADYRLSRFDAVTLGIEFGRQTRRGEWSSRIELYEQSGEASAGAAVGSLAGLDLNPDLSAVIAQFSYKFGR